MSTKTEAIAPALATLQKSVDDLTARIADHPKTSLAVRFARAYKSGATEDQLNAACDLVQSALDDARASIDRIVNAPAKKKAAPVTVPSRGAVI